MDILMAALDCAVAIKALVVALLMWVVTPLIGRIAPRGVAPLALAAMALMEFANLFYWHRPVDDTCSHCVEQARATFASRRDRHAHAVDSAHDAGRNGSGSARQVELAR